MKNPLLLLIIPFLSFGQCEDESACNYNDPWSIVLECQYPGDNNCEPFAYFDEYSFDEDCNCVQTDFCEDETACNYGVSFEGFVYTNPQVMTPELLGEYDEAPYCIGPGDSCNVLAPMSIIPSPILSSSGFFQGWGYSGLLDENCNCICTNPENIAHFVGYFGEYYVFDECPIFGCLNIAACNYNPDATYDDASCVLPGGNCISDNGNPGIYNISCECIEIVSSINEVIFDKKILTKIDILGRETTNEGFQLHLYDDGSVKKAYKIR